MKPTSEHVSSSLYERIGGDAGLQSLLQAFYSRVLSDHELKPFFETSSIEKLLRMQHEFFSTALGGPASYSGMNLSHAHAGRGISSHHFNLFSQHMLETLRELDLEEKDILEVVHRVSVLKNDITGEAY